MSGRVEEPHPDLMLRAWNMVPVVVADLKSNVLMVSSAVVSMFGWEREEELVGHLVTDYVAPEDRDRAAAILDWVMPGLAGVDVCRRIRSLESDQPPHIIILTSRGEKTDIVTGLEAGADDYLAKPFDPGELLARVDVGRRMIELQAKLIEARDALAHEAMHDPLTGVLNRRAFASVLSREISRERRHHDGLAVGICDIDHFKRINDTYGHQTGDEVLCGLVRLIESNLRGHDVLGRHGGDEFVVLTEHAREDGAGILYERLRAAVADSPVHTGAGDVPITISLGVKVWAADETETELLAAADRALYQAKSSGRNRVWLDCEPAQSSK